HGPLGPVNLHAMLIPRSALEAAELADDERELRIAKLRAKIADQRLQSLLIKRRVSRVGIPFALMPKDRFERARLHRVARALDGVVPWMRFGLAEKHAWAPVHDLRSAARGGDQPHGHVRSGIRDQTAEKRAHPHP